MNTTNELPPIEVFDGRGLGCEQKRPAFLSRCYALPAGRSFIFVNEHDPVPLRAHLDRSYPGSFAWAALDSAEPGAIRLQITKLAEPVGGFDPGESVSCS